MVDTSLSRLLSVFKGWHANLGTEAGREIVRGVEIEAIGYLLNTQVRDGEKLLGALYAQLLLIERRGDTRIFFEKLAEVAVADATLGRYLLDGYRRLQGLANTETGAVDDVDMNLIVGEQPVALKGIHQTYHKVHGAGQYLLRVGQLFHRHAVGLTIESDDLLAEADAVDGLVNRQEACPHAVVHVLSFESYPEAFPPILLSRMISVPFAGEEQKHVTPMNLCLFLVGRTKKAAALNNIQQLIFVEYPAAVDIEIIAVSMSMGRIAVSRDNLLIPHGADGKPP